MPEPDCKMPAIKLKLGNTMAGSLRTLLEDKLRISEANIIFGAIEPHEEWQISQSSNTRTKYLRTVHKATLLEGDATEQLSMTPGVFAIRDAEDVMDLYSWISLEEYES